jgi:hypothetical protein
MKQATHTKFAQVIQTMPTYFTEPNPACAAVRVVSLPRGALIDIDAILSLK